MGRSWAGHELESQFEFDGTTEYADGNAATLFAEKQHEHALRRLGWVIGRGSVAVVEARDGWVLHQPRAQTTVSATGRPPAAQPAG